MRKLPNETTRESSPYRRNHHRHGTHNVLLGLVPPASRVLDVGCADGYLGQALASKGCRIWGLDKEPWAITASPGCYEEVRLINLEEISGLPWREGSFDVVLAADVLEHLREPGRVLRMLRRYVAPGGCVIVSLPNVAHASVRFSLLAGRFSYRTTGILDETHCRLYTFSTARKLIESSGLRLAGLYAGSNHFGALLGPRSPVRRVLRGLLAYNIIAKASPADPQD